MIAATGEPLAVTRRNVLDREGERDEEQESQHPAATTDATIARGTLRNGSLASSARFAAESKPTSVVRPMIIAGHQPAADGEVVGRLRR